MGGRSRGPSRYNALAEWFHLLTAPHEYVEEAAAYRALVVAAAQRPVETMLELGSGGGNNASHLKAHFELTLVDLSPAMLALSRTINPVCEHVEGDMRALRLRRQFDAVMINDAICYLTTEDELQRALETAFVHCAPGGAALFCPDHVRENYVPATEHGGHDDGPRGLRYVRWAYDANPADTVTDEVLAYIIREADGSTRSAMDHDQYGLFPRDRWLGLLAAVGFEARFEADEWGHGVFVGLRPA